jgi:hypothetical protein
VSRRTAIFRILPMKPEYVNNLPNKFSGLNELVRMALSDYALRKSNDSRLQNRLHQFNSGRGLHSNPLNSLEIICYRFVRADSLLTIRFLLFQERYSKGLIDRFGGVLLHPRNDVAVEIKRDADPAVSSRSLVTFGWTPLASRRVALTRSRKSCRSPGVVRHYGNTE